MAEALSFSRRIRLPKTNICNHCAQQTRNATLLKRPRRPYTFTQLVTLSDGSSYLHRTTSPQPVYRTTKDIRNSLLWNPTNSALRNVEEDEAGRLAAFRSRFGGNYELEDGKQRKEEAADSESGQVCCRCRNDVGFADLGAENRTCR